MPKILMLTNRIPFPLKDGGSLAMHYFLEGYIAAGVTLSLLSMQTSRHYVDVNQLPTIYKQLNHFKIVAVDNSIKPLDAFLNLFSNKSYNISRFESKAFEQALIQLIKENTFDFIQLESLYLTPYVSIIRKYTNAKIILRSHNIEYKIWERLYIQCQQPLKKWYLKLLSHRLKHYEHTHLSDYDIILPISEQDRLYYLNNGSTSKLYTLSFGIDASKNNDNLTKIDHYANPLKIYHIGAMDWLPNIEAVEWLIDKVMPEVRKHQLPIELHLAGRNMDEKIKRKAAKDIIIAGEVANAGAYEADKHVLCVPLLSGGGVRIKIFEALAQGKAIITTPVGCEGIDVHHEKEILIADDEKSFANHIITIYHNRSLIKSLGVAGKIKIKNEYNRPAQINALLQYLNSL